MVMDTFPRPVRSAIVESSSRPSNRADSYRAATPVRTPSPEHRELLGSRLIYLQCEVARWIGPVAKGILIPILYEAALNQRARSL